MPRTIWKGAIAFGLVHIPVALRAASRGHALDFDWVDRRDKAPVGYRRVNKRTGKEIDRDDIVKGYQYARGQYVLLSDEDFKAANPEATQTVDIVGFADAAQITPEYFVTPYWLEALRRGEKGYALLRDVLSSTGRVGLAKVVIHNRQHLATLLVRGNWLMLVTMRFADEVLAPDEKGEVGKQSASKAELEMARRLVDDMTSDWKPDEHHDTYRDDLLKRVEQLVEAGDVHELAEPGVEAGGKAASGRQSAQVIDLMSALRASLDRGDARKAPAASPSAKSRPAKRSQGAAKGDGAGRGSGGASKAAGETAGTRGKARKSAAKAPARSKTAGSTARKRA